MQEDKIELEAQSLLEARLRDVSLLIRFACHEMATPMGIVGTALSFLLESSLKLKTKVDNGSLTQGDLSEFLKQLEIGLTMASKNNLAETQILTHFRSLAVPQCVDSVKLMVLAHLMEQVNQALSARLKNITQEIHLSVPLTLEVRTRCGALSNVLLNLLDYVVSSSFQSGQQGDIGIEGKRDDIWVMIDITHDGDCPLSLDSDLNTEDGEPGRMTMKQVASRVSNELQGELNVELGTDGNQLIRLKFPDLKMEEKLT